MSSLDFIANFLERVKANGDTAISMDEIANWPDGMFDILINAKLIEKSSPTQSVICQGCEENCLMEVNVLPGSQSKPARAFIVCDKRDDIGRVAVNLAIIEEWHASYETLMHFIAASLNLPTNISHEKSDHKFHIGIFKGHKNKRPLFLSIADDYTLLLAGHEIPLIDCLEINNDALTINHHKLTRFVDEPKGTDETADERKRRLTKRVKELKNQKKKNFLELAAKEEGISVSRLKAIIKSKIKNKKKNILHGIYDLH